MSLLRLIAIGVLLIVVQIPAIAQEAVTVRGGGHSSSDALPSTGHRPSDTMRKLRVEI